MKLHKIDSDLEYAVEFNGGLNLNDVLGVRACVYGENDEASWYWLVKFKDGKWGMVEGGCDYTGWDCQSSLTVLGITETRTEAINLAPEVEEYRGRKIRQALRKQVTGKEAFGVINGEDN